MALDTVTNIGAWAFSGCTALTNVAIPKTLSRIRWGTFGGCTSLTSVTIPPSVTNIDWSAFSGCSSLASLFIPNRVTEVAPLAFAGCSSLTRVTLPSSLVVMSGRTFLDCARLTEVYFQSDRPLAGSDDFDGCPNATVYYLPGTTGWGATFCGRPTALWKPQVQTSDPSFGLRTNTYGFTILWANDKVVVVEACTDLAHPIWAAVGTNALSDGSAYFSDPGWMKSSARFYRLRSP